MPESKNERNARMLNTLHGNYVTAHVVWNMVRELKADEVRVDCNGCPIQPQRQAFMEELSWDDDRVWHVSYLHGLFICRFASYDETDDVAFARWADAVAAAKPLKQQEVSASRLWHMANEMLDDFTFNDMCEWAESRGIDYTTDSSDRDIVQESIIDSVGVYNWALHFGVLVVGA